MTFLTNELEVVLCIASAAFNLTLLTASRLVLGVGLTWASVMEGQA